MGLRAKYDLSEDRMHLTLAWGEGAVQHFWVTRRIWLGLMYAIAHLPPEGLSDQQGYLKPLDNQVQKPTVKPVSDEPLLLKNIHLRSLQTGFKLIFKSVTGQGLSMDLSPETLLQLKTVVQQQAANAGWDVEAFQTRMSSAEMARAAVQKARLH